MTPLQLHIPDEPIGHLAKWRALVADGASMDDVIDGPGGVVDWYWSRWRSVESLGMDRAMFASVSRGHRRELALWIRGERTHAATASGLAGRVARRLDRPSAPPRSVAQPDADSPRVDRRVGV